MESHFRTRQLLQPLRALLDALPATPQSTKEHREALQQELARVIQTATESEDYSPINADTYPEVATCEKAIEDMLAHEQKVKEDEERQREEEAQARTNKLLAELRATREKIRVWRLCKEGTKEHREALQQVLARVLQTANS